MKITKYSINKKEILEEAQRPKGSIFRKTAGVANPYRSILAKSIVEERKKATDFSQKADNVETAVQKWRPSFNQVSKQVDNLRNMADTHRKRAGVISATNSLHIPQAEFYQKIGKVAPNNGLKYTISKGGIQHWNDLNATERKNIYNANQKGSFNPSQKVYHTDNNAIRERISTGVEKPEYYTLNNSQSLRAPTKNTNIL